MIQATVEAAGQAAGDAAVTAGAASSAAQMMWTALTTVGVAGGAAILYHVLACWRERRRRRIEVFSKVMGLFYLVLVKFQLPISCWAIYFHSQHSANAAQDANERAQLSAEADNAYERMHAAFADAAELRATLAETLGDVRVLFRMKGDIPRRLSDVQCWAKPAHIDEADAARHEWNDSTRKAVQWFSGHRLRAKVLVPLYGLLQALNRQLPGEFAELPKVMEEQTADILLIASAREAYKDHLASLKAAADKA